MTIFLALITDAYRELNSKKLFWIILGLSGIVVLTFGSIGFDETGMSMFFGLQHIDNEMLTRDSFLSKILYRSLFSSFMIGIWLTWIATILALISTTTIFPDFIAGGAIDIVLAKPITRVKLFFYKYLTGLLFVMLQISVFCVGVFLCLGLRLDDWNWLVFAAIPLVVTFYSYLFSVNVLFGVWTRSALAALLVTFLMWFSLFSVNATEAVLNQIKISWIIEVEELDEDIARFEDQLTLAEASESGNMTAEGIQDMLDASRASRDEKQHAIDTMNKYHQPVGVMKAILPKTGETIALLDRWLTNETDINLMDIFTGGVAMDDSGSFNRARSRDSDRDTERRMEAEIESRSGVYVIGTSLAFEFVVLALACFIFVRRDY